MKEWYVIMALHIMDNIDYFKCIANNKIIIMSPLSITQEEEKQICDVFQDVVVISELDFHDENTLVSIIEEKCTCPKRIIAIEEYCLLVAAYCREYFGIGGVWKQKAIVFRDKLFMIEALKGSSIKKPNYIPFNSEEDIKIMLRNYGKVILKPRLGMGSKDTFILTDEGEIPNVLCRMRKDKSYILEEFIEGDVYHCDAVVENGKALFVNSMKYLDFQYKFATNRYSRAISVMDVNLRSRLEGMTREVINVLAIENGVIHLEIIESCGSLFFCEIALRAGGTPIPQCVKSIYGIDLIESDIGFQIGKKTSEVKSLGVYGGWIEFFPREGAIKRISSDETFNQYNWITYADIKYTVGETIHEPKHCSDVIASFSVIGHSENDILNKFEIIEKNLMLEYE